MSSCQNKCAKFLLRLSRCLVGFNEKKVLKIWRAHIELLAYITRFPSGMQGKKIEIANMKAEWIFSPSDTDENSPVIFYIHGGGYVMGSIQCYRPLAGRIAQASGGKLLLFDYRLAPEHPFPAALEDCLLAYRWLLKQKIDPRQIVIAGDSAGGGLTLATLITLRDAGEPLPAAAVCISPWTDLAVTGESIKTKVKEDPMTTPQAALLCARLYLNGIDPKTPMASPLYADLSNLPPLLVQVGSAELLLSDSLRLVEKAKAVGVDVTLEVWEDLFHVFHVFADYIPEGKQAIEKIGNYVRRHV